MAKQSQTKQGEDESIPGVTPEGETEEKPAKGGKKAPAKQQDKGDQLPASMADMEAYADAGLEDADADAFAIPFLQILQSNSPQVKRSDPAYIKGAQEGMIVNTVSGELFNTDDEGIQIVPCHYRRAFTAWVPRDHGGGFRGEVAPNDPVLGEAERDTSGKLWHAGNGLEYLDTRYHYVLLVRSDGSYEPALITMSSTQIKKSRQINTRLNNFRAQGSKGKFTPPTFGLLLTLHTASEQKDDYTWFGWRPDFSETGLRLLSLDNEAERELFFAGRDFRDQVKAGAVQEVAPDQGDVSGDDAAASQY